MAHNSIVEIAVEVTDMELRNLVLFLAFNHIPYYVEPPRYKTLEEVEAACEGK